MRKKLIVGNWKMHLTRIPTRDLVNLLKPLVENADADVVFCVPAVNLVVVDNMLNGCKIALGAQNMHYEDKGAYTGEISAPMLADIGAKYIIIGHSERRTYFGEKDIDVNKKILKAIEHSLTPIICVGETMIQRDQGITTELVRMQAKIALLNVTADQAKKAVIAYEPVWAIGTGRTATKEQAQEVCQCIRTLVAELYDAETAEAIRILYGGSVKANNAYDLFSMPDIDGGLIGSASISSEFAEIVNYTDMR